MASTAARAPAFATACGEPATWFRPGLFLPLPVALLLCGLLFAPLVVFWRRWSTTEGASCLGAGRLRRGGCAGRARRGGRGHRRRGGARRRRGRFARQFRCRHFRGGGHAADVGGESFGGERRAEAGSRQTASREGPQNGTKSSAASSGGRHHAWFSFICGSSHWCGRRTGSTSLDTPTGSHIGRGPGIRKGFVIALATFFLAFSGRSMRD